MPYEEVYLQRLEDDEDDNDVIGNTNNAKAENSRKDGYRI